MIITFDHVNLRGSEKDRKEKDAHVRATHTFECNICDLRQRRA